MPRYQSSTRRRLLVVDPEARADRLRLVVLATNERAAALRRTRCRLRGPCTASGSSRRPCGRSAGARSRRCRCRTPSTASTFRPSRSSTASSPSACGTRAHDAVEHHAVARTAGLASVSSHDAEDDGVGHEVAAVHERLRLEPQRRAGSHRGCAARRRWRACGTFSAAASSGACVPFPAPGFPKRTMIICVPGYATGASIAMAEQYAGGAVRTKGARRKPSPQVNDHAIPSDQ